MCEKLISYEFGEYKWSSKDQGLYENDKKINLNDCEKKVLLCLLKNHGSKVEMITLVNLFQEDGEKFSEVEISKILKAANGRENIKYRLYKSRVDSIYGYISGLRKHLRDSSRGSKFILMEGKGYTFISKVIESQENNIENSESITEIESENNTYIPLETIDLEHTNNDESEIPYSKNEFDNNSDELITDYDRDDSISNHQWNSAIWGGVSLVIVVMGFALYYVYLQYKEIENLSDRNKTLSKNIEQLSSNSKDNFAKITIQKAEATLNMDQDGWNDILTEKERLSSEEKSRAVYEVNYQVTKYFETDKFPQRIGTFSNKPPTWENISDHSATDFRDIPESETDKRCASGLKTAKMLYFDISKEKIKEPFDLNFKVNYYNAHNKQKGEDHSVFVHHPMDKLIFRIKFPKTKKNYPKEIKLSRHNGCNDRPGTEIPKQTKAEMISNLINNYDYAENEKTISYVFEDSTSQIFEWHIENPKVNNSYKIMWKWAE